MHHLKLTDDEIQRLLTRVYSETGYRLDRKDPIIVQYVVQRILLRDFDENQARLFDDLSGRILPGLRNEAKKLEEQKDRLWELSRSTAADVVRRSGVEYTQHIRDAMRKTDDLMLSNLNEHVARLRTEQNDILAKLREKHRAFDDTAAQFSRTISYIFFVYIIFTGIIVLILTYYLKN